MKRVFIIHGWDGTPEDGWFPWLKQELESRGFAVSVPEMPNPEEPVIAEWEARLEEVIGTPDSETFLLGHSIGCQTIMRYLAMPDRKIGGAVYVAGWFTLTGLETEHEHALAKPWLETPIAFSNVRANAPAMTAIFSDNDPFVPCESNVRGFMTALDPDIVIEKGKGHFIASHGVTELPSALEALLQMAS